MNTVNITLNRQKITCDANATILSVATEHNIKIPTLCYLKELEAFASCWICIVQIQGMNRYVPACSTKVAEGMVIETDTDKIRAARKMNLELLLSDHCGDCLGPCQVYCPAGCNIPEFIAQIAQNDDAKSLKIIKETIPLPASLGRVCPAPCEDECRRHGVDKPVSICFLKRFAADQDLKQAEQYVPTPKAKTGKKVAIIGAGPAGLSAAYYLLSEGHAVTIYESHQAPGGMMRYGIPAYRLPRDVMDQEVEPILKMGGKIEYNTTLGQNIHFADLQKQKFDAYFIATGAQLASAMRVPGENLPGVMSGIDFLARVSEGEKLQLGQTVLVIGGGNTAIDAARTSRRLGANDVAIIYRRTRNEMPAYHVEVEDAVHEGVTLTFLMAPVKVEIQNGRLALHVIRMELGAPDASGRQRPVPVNGSEHVIMADTIISAIGQAVDPKVLDSIGLELTKWGSVKVDAKTFATNIPGIFAGGDCVTGPDLAVRAVGAGRLAAIAMDQYLRGEKVVGAAWEFNSSYGPRDQAPAKFYEKARPIERAKMPEMAATTRTGTFDEVASGFPADVARQEALRCLECRCNKQHDCTLRDLASEYQIDPDRFKGERRGYDLDRTLPTMVLDVGKCINCGTCARICESVQELYGLGFTGRGFTARIKPPFRRELTVALQETCQKCIESCPCGALSEPSKNSSK